MNCQCEKCKFYNAQYDEHRQKWNDTDDQEKHFCCMYDKGIPDEIIQDKEKCEFKI